MKLLAALAFVLALAATARAQERGPSDDDHQDSNQRRPLVPDEPARKGASSYDPSDEAPPPGTEGPNAPAKPAPAPAEGEEGPSILDRVELNGRIRLSLGYDSNVFRAEVGKTGDGFFHGYGEVDALAHLPTAGELFASLSGEGLDYFSQKRGNEAYATSFVDLYQPLSAFFDGSPFDIELQNTFGYSALSLLNDNGDLLPIGNGKYDGFDEDGRASLILHTGERVSLELIAGARYRFFDDTLFNYWEARAGAGVRVKLWTEARLKLRYVFREREYSELAANVRNGSAPIGDPTLEIQRHQLTAIFSQTATDLFGTRLVALVSYTFTYNLDTFQNDRTYQEHSVAAHVEWSPFVDWTMIAVDVRGGDRPFLVHRTTQRGGLFPGTRLEQSYLEATVSVSQKVWDHVSLVGELSYYFYHSTDVNSSYERLVMQIGIEGSF